MATPVVSLRFLSRPPPSFLPQTFFACFYDFPIEDTVVLFADHNATATAGDPRRTHQGKRLPKTLTQKHVPLILVVCSWSLQWDHCPIVAVPGLVLYPGKCPRRVSDRIPHQGSLLGFIPPFLTLALLETKRASIVSSFRTWL